MPDVIRSTLEMGKKTFKGHAHELLARFPGINHTELLTQITALYLLDFRYGNKREEREACNFLNLLQQEAVKLLNEKADENSNEPH